MPERVHVVEDVGAVSVLLQPLRIRMLEALQTPASAATLARQLGTTRQKCNYHLKELERAGFVEVADERRVGNLVETRYRAVARSFVVSPHATVAGEARAEALRHQVSLEQLLQVGERLQQNAIALLDRAAFDGEEIASASVEATVRFADERERAAFLHEYMQALTALCDRYGAPDGAPYRIVLAAHPVDEMGDQP
jgi:predicted ArsR family transcriptional regulator